MNYSVVSGRVHKMLEVLYQDEWLVAVNKPSGLLVHRSFLDRHETQFAMQMVRDQIGQHVYPVHRLDRPTSGVLLFALDSDTARLMTELFANKEMEKQYLAVARGYLKEAQRLDYPLKEKLDKIADKFADQDKEAQDAVTCFYPINQVELNVPVGRYATARYSLVKAIPETGRKHQIRRHLSHLRHPIIGDTTHGDGKHNKMFRDDLSVRRLLLVAKQLSFVHPVKQTKLEIQAPLGEEVLTLFEKLGWPAQESDYKI